MPFNWLRVAKAEETKAEQEAKEKAARENVWTRDSDLLSKLKAQEAQRATWWSTIFLAYGSLGVIYGDIGTSIIYVFSQIFATVGNLKDEDPQLLEDSVLGAESLIFWSLTLVALVKYVGVVLRANDTGEGGTVALYAQLCRTMGISPFGTMRLQDHQQVLAMTSAASFQGKRPNLGEHRHRSSMNDRCDSSKTMGQVSDVAQLPVFKPWHPPLGFAVLEGFYVTRWFRRTRAAQRALLFLTMIATGLVIGDGVLMPAFSVNSAISGIQQHTQDSLDSGAMVGISVAIIVLLFFSQQFGTQKIAFTFSPIIILWLLANLGIAIHNLQVYGPRVFNGLNPYYIYVFFNTFKRQGWEMLGGVMLAVSGTETMFAAMGHFSQPAVALAFGCFAYPCLVLTYLGQGAYLLKHPEDSRTAFWSSIPEPIFWPMLVLATSAAIVASQAVITGTFSIVRQATALGVFPKLRIVHTDDFVEGQIFIPSVNYTLMLLCIAVIAGYGGNNDRLGDAYGVAVMAVMLITTFMVSLIMLVKWDVSVLVVVPFFLGFVLIEGVFLSANLFKVPSGGWFPLAVAAVVCFIMTVWWLGQGSRRKVTVRSGKQLDAASFFTIFNQDAPPQRPLRKTSFRSMRSEFGSATDLTSIPLTAAGYAPRTSPQRPPVIRMSSKDKDNESEQQQQHPLSPQQVLRTWLAAAVPGAPAPALAPQEAQPPLPPAPPASAPPPPVAEQDEEEEEEEEGQRHVAPAPQPPSLQRASAGDASQRPALGRVSGGPMPAQRDPRPSSADGRVGPLDGAGGALSLSDVNVRMGSGTSRVRFAAGQGAEAAAAGMGSPRSPSRINGLQSPGIQRVSAYSKASSTGGELVLPPRPTMALMECPTKPLAKLSGLGLYYSDSPMGVPHILRHFLKNADALHEAGIFLTVRFLPMPIIKNAERFLVRAVQGLPNFYQVVARYGYQDSVDHSERFVQQIITTIVHKLELKAGLMYQGLENDFIHELEGDYEEDDSAPVQQQQQQQQEATARSVFGLETVHETYGEEEEQELSALEAEVASPFVSRFALAALARIKVVASAPDASETAIDALGAARTLIDKANERVVYYLGRAFTRPAAKRSFIHTVTIGGLFRTLEMLSYQDSEAWLIPVDNMVELGVALEV